MRTIFTGTSFAYQPIHMPDKLSPALPWWRSPSSAEDVQPAESIRLWPRAPRWRSVLYFALLSMVGAYLGATALRIYVREYYIFLPDYIRRTFLPGDPSDDSQAGVTVQSQRD